MWSHEKYLQVFVSLLKYSFQLCEIGECFKSLEILNHHLNILGNSNFLEEKLRTFNNFLRSTSDYTFVMLIFHSILLNIFIVFIVLTFLSALILLMILSKCLNFYSLFNMSMYFYFITLCEM